MYIYTPKYRVTLCVYGKGHIYYNTDNFKWANDEYDKLREKHPVFCFYACIEDTQTGEKFREYIR